MGGNLLSTGDNTFPLLKRMKQYVYIRGGAPRGVSGGRIRRVSQRCALSHVKDLPQDLHGFADDGSFITSLTAPLLRSGKHPLQKYCTPVDHRMAIQEAWSAALFTSLSEYTQRAGFVLATK